MHHEMNAFAHLCHTVNKDLQPMDAKLITITDSIEVGAGVDVGN